MSSISPTEPTAARALRRALSLLAAAAAWSFAPPAGAATRLHVLAIGNNAPFAGGKDAASRSPLRYADDDAAAFTELVGDAADSSELLTAMDRDTQLLFPRLAGAARLPTRERVRAAVSRISSRIRARQAEG
ncbi:MAG TPA: hypothetical protein VGK73_03710, partial [Polyangiaceae bacterium]